MSKILVTRTFLPEFEEYMNEIKDLWETRWITNMGTKHNKLIDQLKTFLGVDHLDLLTNGHLALELSVQALGLTGEIITTPFTFASTTHAIVRNGCTPVFCDINLDDYTIDVSKIEGLITDKTSAIMPVHVYGNLCDVDSIRSIAKKYGLKVIYDAAHAFGVRKDGKGIAAHGDVSCFSFHATKVFNTIEGGAACYHDTDFGNKLYQLKNFGIKNEESIIGVGANAKMNEFCSAMGLCNLRHIDSAIFDRRRVCEHYYEKLCNIEGIKMNKAQEGVQSNYAYCPILIDEKLFGSSRNEVADALADQGVFARKYFYPITNSFECYNGRFNAYETPKALYASKRILTLPLYPDLESEVVDKICDIIISCQK